MAFRSYAQNFEDLMLYRALGKVERDFYIDIGAQHPEIEAVVSDRFGHTTFAVSRRRWPVKSQSGLNSLA